MYIGDKVETTCKYSKTMNGKYLKGRIISISKTDDTVVEVQSRCGCKTWINKHWLQETDCWFKKSNRCCCCC